MESYERQAAQAPPGSPPIRQSQSHTSPLQRFAFSKSRKSSCALCHRRKIRCDQVRPACSSCVHRDIPCSYSDDVVDHGSFQLQDPATATTTTKASWLTVTSSDAMPVKSREAIRNRVLNGFDSSSSDDELVGVDHERSPRRSGTAPLRKETTSSRTKTPEDVDELADQLVESPRQTSVPFATQAEEKAAEASKRGRDVSMDDEISGELLELASAPKPKPKKLRPSTSRPNSFAEPSMSASLPRPVHSVTLPPPTKPSSSASHKHQRSHAYPPTPGSATHQHSPYTTSLLSLLSALPSADTQTILFNTFFSDPFLSLGISLLRPQYLDDFRTMLKRRNHGKLREGDATTLANAFAILAVSLRILPEETSRLFLSAFPPPPSATHSGINGWPASPTTPGPVYPRSLSRILAALPPLANDPVPLHARYFDLALLASHVAEQSDPPSVMLVMLKLILFRYSVLGLRTDRLLPAGGWLAQGIKVAQALGMGKEWEGIPQGERELRRRVMWALYVADRQHSYSTTFPYTILDQHNMIALPSPISEQDLYLIPPDAPTLPPHLTDTAPTPCTSLFIQSHLSRLITPILDSFVTLSPAGTPHELVLRFDSSLSAFQDALPSYLRIFPLTNTQFDSQHPYLPAHRTQLHAQLLAYRLGIHRSHLPQYLDPATPPPARKLIAQLCTATLRVHRSARLLDPKVAPRLFSTSSVFEAAASLGAIMHVDKLLAGSMAVSDDWLAMRSAAAEAIEMLDGAGTWADAGSLAKKAALVLREMMVRLDARSSDFPKVPDANGHDVAVTSPKAEAPSTFKSPAISPSRNPSPVATPISAPADAVRKWLDRWRGLNLEHLLREADWSQGWEPIITAM